jgi:hypothetical protein
MSLPVNDLPVYAVCKQCGVKSDNKYARDRKGKKAAWNWLDRHKKRVHIDGDDGDDEDEDEDEDSGGGDGDGDDDGDDGDGYGDNVNDDDDDDDDDDNDNQGKDGGGRSGQNWRRGGEAKMKGPFKNDDDSVTDCTDEDGAHGNSDDVAIEHACCPRCGLGLVLMAPEHLELGVAARNLRQIRTTTKKLVTK